MTLDAQSIRENDMKRGRQNPVRSSPHVNVFGTYSLPSPDSVQLFNFGGAVLLLLLTAATAAVAVLDGVTTFVFEIVFGVVFRVGIVVVLAGFVAPVPALATAGFDVGLFAVVLVPIPVFVFGVEVAPVVGFVFGRGAAAGFVAATIEPPVVCFGVGVFFVFAGGALEPGPGLSVVDDDDAVGLVVDDGVAFGALMAVPGDFGVGFDETVFLVVELDFGLVVVSVDGFVLGFTAFLLVVEAGVATVDCFTGVEEMRVFGAAAAFVTEDIEGAFFALTLLG